MPHNPALSTRKPLQRNKKQNLQAEPKEKFQQNGVINMSDTGSSHSQKSVPNMRRDDGKSGPLESISKRARLNSGSGMEDSPVARTLFSRFQNYRGSRRRIQNEWDRAYTNFIGVYRKELKAGEGVGWRTKAFYPITMEKVNAGLANLSETLYQGGRFPFDIKLTPIVDSPNEQLMAAQLDLQERVDNHRQLIDDELSESDALKEFLPFLESIVLYGTGVIKSPITIEKIRNSYVPRLKEGAGDVPTIPPPPAEGEDNDQAVAEFQQAQQAVDEFFAENIEFELEQSTEMRPALRNIDVYDFFPDPEKFNVQEGQGCFERQFMTPAEFSSLKDKVEPTGVDEEGKAIFTNVYDDDQIDAVIANQKAGQKTADQLGLHRRQDENFTTERNIEVLHFAGEITNKQLADGGFGDVGGFDMGSSGQIAGTSGPIEKHEILATIVGNRIIRLIKNNLPGKMRPYHKAVWTEIPGTVWGRGVGRNLRDSQSVLNGMLRAYIDNKNLSSNLMFAVDKGKLMTGTDVSTRPGKVWEFQTGTNVREAFQSITIPDVSGDIIEGMRTVLEWADAASGIPKVLEGDTQPGNQTAFETNQQVTAANKGIGQVIKNIDRAVSDIVQSFYHWNMAFFPDDSIKADFDVEATGFRQFQNKTLRQAKLNRLLALAASMDVDPETRLLIKKEAVIKELTKSDDLDPNTFLRTEEEVKQLLDENAQREAQAQAAAAQQIAQAQQAETDSKMQIDAQKLGADAQEQELARGHESEENSLDRQLELSLKELDLDDKQQERADELVAALRQNNQQNKKPGV